jgi:uncharacterized protein (DUF1778 family)
MKNKTIRFRITSEQYAQILKSASNSRKNLSEWIRESLKISSDRNLVERRLQYVSEVQNLSRQISLIGNNINQVARLANAKREFQQIEEFSGVLDSIKEKVRDLR